MDIEFTPIVTIDDSLISDYNGNSLFIASSRLITNNASHQNVSYDQDFTTMNDSEKVEVFYQSAFFVIGAPINIYCLRNFYKRFANFREQQANERRQIRLSTQLLIAHLLVLGISNLLRTYWLLNVHWSLGDTGCKLFSFLITFPYHLWSNIVATIAIDTLYCVAKPMSSVTNGNRRVSFLIALSWSLSFLFAFPMVVFRGAVPIPNSSLYQCYHLVDIYPQWQIYGFQLFHVITSFYLPLVVIVICYFFIGKSLRHHAELRNGLVGNHTVVPEMMRTATRRFLKATLLIVSTFVLTWLPYQVIALFRVLCEPESRCEKATSNLYWLQSILLLSTCINPFLYRFGIFRTTPRSSLRHGFFMIGGTTTNFFDKAWHQTIGRNSDQQTQSRAWLTTLFHNRHQLAQSRTSRGSKMNIRRSASATLQQNQNGILRKQQNGIVRKTTDAGVVNGNLYRHNNCNGYRRRETEEIVSHIASEEDSANIDLIHSLL